MFHGELSPQMDWRGPRSPGTGGDRDPRGLAGTEITGDWRGQRSQETGCEVEDGDILYLTIQSHHHNDSCIKMETYYT